MNGYQYENKCAELLKAKGFTRVKVTPGSGDYGVDILAEKDGKKYGIQCKYYEGNVGVKAVQEAVAGTLYYQCDVAMVITNANLTPQAITFAKKVNAVIWTGIDAIYLQKHTAEYIRQEEERRKAEAERRRIEEKQRQKKIKEQNEKARIAREEAILAAENARKDEILKSGIAKMTGESISDYEAAFQLFQSIPGWKDADKHISACKTKIKELEEKAFEERKAAKERAKRNRKRFAIFAILTIAVTLVVTKIIIPARNYNRAVALMEEGEYAKARILFFKAGNYKDSREQYTTITRTFSKHSTVEAGSGHTVGLKPTELWSRWETLRMASAM